MTDNGITKKDIITATTMTVASGGTTGIITVHQTLTSLPSCARGAKPYRRRYPCDQQEGRKLFESADSSHRSSFSNRAVDFLQQPARADEPFLMVVSYDEPHHPFTCPVEYLEKYADFYYELGEKAQDDLANKPEHPISDPARQLDRKSVV